MMGGKWILGRIFRVRTLSALAVTGLILGIIVWRSTGQDLAAGGDGPDAEPVNKSAKTDSALPIRQVVLFNSGVGYFQREGEVEGDARVELSFPTSDINDLLKSLILQDLSGGRISSVNYDSHDPIDKILHSFALDLNNNPTLGQILNQARGEKVEMHMAESKSLTGIIVGMEMKKQGKDDVEMLNLSTDKGLTSMALSDVKTIRFLNPVLENEFQRALKVLAASHDTQKKTVSLGFNGVGKRQVRVGYVVEHPIWKTSYRLSIDKGGKVYIQGWAIVENTSDEDWNDVRMVLVSGRPISYKMNMYEPLYIPRPQVEPELFASLRPPVYGGALGNQLVPSSQIAGITNLGVGRAPAVKSVSAGIGNDFTAIPSAVCCAPAMPGGGNNYLPVLAGAPLGYAVEMPGQQPGNKLSYEQLQQRRQAADQFKTKVKHDGAAIAGLNFKEGIASVATADELGDYYQYVIDQKITLPRQKSALLPILDQTIAGAKVSIYNEATHAKFPLLGLKLKNSSKQPLSQGPITVYEDGSYAGDTRILDLQPGEERFLSYALDQAVEVKSVVTSSPSPDMTLKFGEAILKADYKQRQKRTYTIKNRASKERTVILEHPIQGGWKLVEPTKPMETTRDLYRFQVNIPADKTVTFDVVEEHGRVDQMSFHPHVITTPSDIRLVSGDGAPRPAGKHIGDAGIQVHVQYQVSPETLLSVKFDKGLLFTTARTRLSKTYFVQNTSGLDRNLTVDHIVAAGWTRLDDDEEDEAGPAVYRFVLPVPKGKTAQREIVEERVVEEKGKLVRDLSEEKIREYLASPAVDRTVKAALAKFLDLNSKVAELQKRLAAESQQLGQLADDQARLRENLKIIPQTSEPYKNFLEKFVAQEGEIEAYQKKIRQLQTALQQQMAEIEANFGPAAAATPVYSAPPPALPGTYPPSGSSGLPAPPR